MTTYHVYADANIFLDFFRFSDDDLGELSKLQKHLDENKITLYLPQLTAEEYARNRDKVVIAQLEEINRTSLKLGIPIFIREMQEAKDFLKCLGDSLEARKNLARAVEDQASARSFRADEIIRAIFDRANRIRTSADLLHRARERLSLGNPPGKTGSVGDRLNWESLLSSIPHGNDLHLITRDNDYISLFQNKRASSFLLEEWGMQKSGHVHLYGGIRSFAKHVDETLVFSSIDETTQADDPARQQSVIDLAASGSFSRTHSVIAKLQKHLGRFTIHELEFILQAALDNGQVGGIMTDNDLTDLYTLIHSCIKA